MKGSSTKASQKDKKKLKVENFLLKSYKNQSQHKQNNIKFTGAKIHISEQLVIFTGYTRQK